MWMMGRKLRLMILGILGLSFVLWGMVACGDPACDAGQVVKDGQCVTLTESTSEKKEESNQEVTSEQAVELTVAEPPVSTEETAVSEPVLEKKEVKPESPTPDEPVLVDASESVDVTPEDGPEPEPVVEEVPEPSGPKPTVEITGPKDGAVIKDASLAIEIRATVATGAQIDRVELYIDGKKWSDTQQTPYRFSISKGRLTDGPHSLKAIAITTRYQQASTQIKITTAANGPTIKFIKPTAGSSVSGAFALVVEVKSALKLKANSVILKVDGKVVTWDKTTPNYEVKFDPKDIAYDSFPIVVTATDQYDLTKSEQLVLVHDPKPGPKKAGEACDNSVALQRCVAGHSCLDITGKPQCYANCDTKAATNPCQTANCLSHKCQPSHMGTKRGVCFPTGPAPGCLNSECTTTRRCVTGLICVGAGTAPSTRRWCLSSCTVGSVLLGCRGKGYKCVNAGTTGVCIELCRQPCKADKDCGDNQTCSNGLCGGPFCQKYGAPCRSIQAGAGTPAFNACI